MAYDWTFPSNCYGTLTGIGEAGIETFKGTPYRSLAREICQNSMDACADKTKPVIVEFKSSKIANDAIPGGKTLKKALQACLEFWSGENNNKKTKVFFENAIEVCQKDYIDVLRISDFNTTGLTGSDKDYNSAWQNLVKSSGVSDKGGTSGGSFGIGKSAPFACSDLRTVFYSTIDNQGLKAYQGIARLVSFKKKRIIGDDPITTGIGYYGNSQKNSAIRECVSITDDFTRQEVGTDVFILGFSKKKDWKDEIIVSVLEDFLYSVYNNKLIVKVDGTTISNKELGSVVTQYADKASKAYNYYLVLTEKNTQHISYQMDSIGSIDLYILLKQNLHRQVMMCRTNGMKVYDQKNISANIQFAGICILNDDGMNQFFREMENPQHNAWEPERHSCPSDAKKAKKALTKYIKDQVIKIGKVTTVDEIDAEGAGEYLADIAFDESNNKKTTESVTDHTKDIEITKPSRPKTQKAKEHIVDPDGDESSTGSSPGDVNGSKSGKRSNRKPNEHNAKDKKFKVEIISSRLYLMDHRLHKYRLVFEPKIALAKCCLAINLSGEQSNIPVVLKSAFEPDTGEHLNFDKNTIFFDTLLKQKHKVEFSINYAESCSLEVELYGYQV